MQLRALIKREVWAGVIITVMAPNSLRRKVMLVVNRHAFVAIRE